MPGILFPWLNHEQSLWSRVLGSFIENVVTPLLCTLESMELASPMLDTLIFTNDDPLRLKFCSGKIIG